MSFPCPNCGIPVFIHPLDGNTTECQCSNGCKFWAGEARKGRMWGVFIEDGLSDGGEEYTQGEMEMMFEEWMQL